MLLQSSGIVCPSHTIVKPETQVLRHAVVTDSLTISVKVISCGDTGDGRLGLSLSLMYSLRNSESTTVRKRRSSSNCASAEFLVMAGLPMSECPLVCFL